MRENTIKTEFIKIGKNFKILAIFSAIHSISVINSFGYIFNIVILENEGVVFNPIVLIYSLINLVSVISLLVIYIYQKRILDSFKKINGVYNNISLRSFHSNLKLSVIMNLIGLIGFFVSISLFLATSIMASNLIDQGYLPQEIPSLLEIYYEISNNMMILLIGSALGTILEIAAWRKLEEFFRVESDIFPESIRQDLIISSSSLIYASAFSFFELGSDLFIPYIGLGSIMGLIYYVLGYRNLGRGLSQLDNKDMELSEIKPKLQPKISNSTVFPSQMKELHEKIDTLVEKVDNLADKIDYLGGNEKN